MPAPQSQTIAQQKQNSAGELQQSVRAGVFGDLRSADAAVARLLAAGFSHDQITVICSDEAKERHFQQFEHQEPAGNHAGDAALAGVSIGAVAGGLTAIAVAGALGGVPLLIAGAAGLSGGSALGGFLGPMLTRGEEKEASNFYDQAVRHDKILVSVEVHGPDAPARLAEAERVFTAAGTEPIQLPEG